MPVSAVKRKKRKKRGLIFVSVLLLLVVLVWSFFSFVINPVIKQVSEEEIRALTVDAVNLAASEVIAEQIDYDDILQITKDSQGNITLIQANTVLINKIARNTTLQAQENISALGQQGIDIPIGSLSGISFLAGRGPNFKLRVLPVGSVDTVFHSEFISAGINQTKHKIYMTVSAQVSVIIPGMNTTVGSDTEVMICENIIVGKIPEVYLQSNRLDQLLNLVP